MKKDNSDGMKQGMCFNNAAQYVASISPEPLSPNDWAKAVYAYAQSLYSMSDLNQPTTEEKDISQAPQTVKDIFGAV